MGTHGHIWEFKFLYWLCFYQGGYWGIVPAHKGLINDDSSQAESYDDRDHPEHSGKASIAGNMEQTMNAGGFEKLFEQLHDHKRHNLRLRSVGEKLEV